MIDYDQVASDYARHRQVHPGVLQGICQEVDITNTFRVLEVGCGTGNYIRALERLAGPACWGIDPSRAMLDEARRQPGEVCFQQGRAEDLEFPAGFFDLVFSVDVIHHIRDHRDYFKEARRVLTAGGKVCTVTDSEWIIRHRQPLAVYFPQTVEVELRRYVPMDQLRGLMAQAGLEGMREEMVEFPYQLSQVQAYRDKAFSALHLISEEAFRGGIERMERDLQVGPISCVARYVLVWGTK
ncbi:MAG: methyltransferase domain-containing protein [Anaerolineales bacterium]|nr:MAG: methyltransferase domain-containing protein [Anaerolineales bacterium]